MNSPSTGFRIVVAVCCCVLLANLNVRAEDPGWYDLDWEIEKQLLTEERDLVTWAEELISAVPTTQREALVKINICLRAGLFDEATEAVHVLHELAPEMSNEELTSLLSETTNSEETLGVARVLIEQFAPQLNGEEVDAFIWHYRQEGVSTEYLSDKHLLYWLDQRIASVEQYVKEHPEKELKKSPPYFEEVSPLQSWKRLRLQYLAEMGQAEPVLQQMEAEIRGNLENGQLILEYLNCVFTVRDYEPDRTERSLDWIADFCRCVRGTELKQIARMLVPFQYPEVAEKVWRLALDVQLTEDELQHIYYSMQSPRSFDVIQAGHAIEVRERLAELLLKQGKIQEAQKYVAAAADIRKRNKLKPNTYLEGLVQRHATTPGSRTLATDIAEGDRTDPEYWQQRAQYYRGRDEFQKEEDALRQGLKLAKPTPYRSGKVSPDIRSRLLGQLTEFLSAQDRNQEAFDLLLEELRNSPANSQAAHRAVSLLTNTFKVHKKLQNLLQPDQAELWDWLSRRDEWHRSEQFCLSRLLRLTPVEGRQAAMARIEQLALADGAHALRVMVLAELQEDVEKKKQLLAHVAENAHDEKLRQEAESQLRAIQFRQSSWREKELMLTVDGEQFRLRADALGELAIAAAKDGEFDEAMRLWRRAANCGLRNEQLATSLARLGLREQLQEYYQEVQRRLPTAKLPNVAK
ncbi:MAG: hypothetical protein R3C18_13810 [Planctomycetaceae bacterium]